MSTQELSLRIATGPVSPQEQIRNYILDQIISGRWPPNHRLPSETELVKVLKVSRMTVHHALKELQRNGLLTRTQGVGTFVAQPRTHPTIINQLDIADEIQAGGGRYSARVVERKLRKASSAEIKIFRLQGKSPRLFHVVVLHLDGDVPKQLEDRLINPVAVPDCEKHDPLEVSLFAFLMRAYPYPHGSFRTRARRPSSEERELLQLARGEPCLEVERTTWTDEHVVTLVRLLYPASAYEIEGTISPRDAGAGW